MDEYEKSYFRMLARLEKQKKRKRRFRILISKIFFVSEKILKIPIFIFSFLLKKTFLFQKKIRLNIYLNFMKYKKKRKEKIEGLRRIKKSKKIFNKERKIKKNKKKKQTKVKDKIKRKFLFFRWFFIILFFFIIIGGVTFFLWFSSLEIPSINSFKERKIINSTKIYDRTGNILLFDIHKDIQRTVIPGDKISPYAKKAIIAIEDHNFYTHHGVNWKSTFRAAIQTIFAKLGFPHTEVAGGSTITQQVIKNTLLTRKKTIKRKIKEWFLAYKLEKILSKDEILTTYLNEAPYGGTIYGIEEASRVFFGKPAKDLNLIESAYLAAIPNRPSFYSPYGSHRKELDLRAKLVLSKMREYGFISDEEYRDALLKKVHFLPKSDYSSKALHFVQYVRSLLEEKYDRDTIENGGLKVITTLDYELQKKAEHIIQEHVKEVEKEGATNAALVALKSDTGDILAMVGSRNYFDTSNFDGNFNVALSPRQPGSSFKPIAYATLFEKGYLPETAIFDVQTQFVAHCRKDFFFSINGCYAPSNWDGKFKGPMSLRNALAQSRNIPALKVMYLAGIKNVLENAKRMGIRSLNKSPKYYGLGLVLGGGEVSLLEMVSAYTTFSQEGIHVKPRAILKIEDLNGNILYESKVSKNRVFSKNVSNMISSILSDNNARTPLYGSHSYLYFGNIDVAGKTGTTNDKRDAWMIGYTSENVLGVWTGNNDNSPMKKGSKLSMKPWRLFMDELIKKYPPQRFHSYILPDDFDSLPPIIRGEWEGEKEIVINKMNGKLATENTPEELKEKIRIFDPHTILYFVNKNNPRVPGNSRNDPQFINWEYGVQRFVKENFKERFEENPSIPEEKDDGKYEIIDFQLEGLRGSYKKDEYIEASLKIDSEWIEKIKEMRIFLNDVYLFSLTQEPFNVLIDLSENEFLNEEDQKQELEIELELKNGIKKRKKFYFSIH